MSTRQGSASYTIVIGGIVAGLVGALTLTFVMFPMYNAFAPSPLFSAETSEGAMLVTYTLGIWEFWGGIILIAGVTWVWVVTRQ
jgi:hypothetical protein